MDAGKGNSPPDPDTSSVPALQLPSKQPPSWLFVASSQPSNLQHHTLSVCEDVSAFEIPDAILDDENYLWKNFLIGRFLDIAPHVAKVHVIVNKIWTYGNKSTQIDVHVVNETTMKFRIQDSATRSKILRRGFWNIANVPLVVSEWSPEAQNTLLEIKSIPLWVDFDKVPGRMYSDAGLSFIGSAVGLPIRLHPDTIACKHFDKARIFTDANLTKELPKTVNLCNKKGFGLKLQSRTLGCTTCKKWDHLHSVCLVQKDQQGTISILRREVSV